MADLYSNRTHLNASQNYAESQDYTSITILSSLAVVIAIINSLVFYLFFKKKSLRTSSNYPLFSLAACDLFTGVVIIPLFIITNFSSVIKSESTKFYFGFLLVVLHNFVAIATVYHIVVVTAERYMAIKMPLRHRVINKKGVYKVLGIVWWTAAAISFIPFAWISTLHPEVHPVSMKLSLGYAIFCLVVALVLPYIFLIAAFVVMFKAMSRKSTKESRNQQLLHRNQSVLKQKAGERKCLVVFATMAVVFAVCWFPSFIVFLITQLVEKEMQTVPKVSLLVRYLTSVIDPLLYTFLKRDFYNSLRFIFTDGKRRRTSSLFTTISRKGTMQTEVDHLPALCALNSRRQSLASQKGGEEGKQGRLCKENPL